MESVFSKIINGSIPSYKVHENDEFLAFLDIQPLSLGHTLVVPKIQIDYLFDFSDDHLSDMMVFAKQVAKKIRTATKCKRVGLAVVGFEVPHAHIHLIPINTISDMNFSNTKLILSSDEFETIANAIKNA